eukprot:TRINITY_DN67242_c3_g6_i3.p1 TRINITY_DN67242_c3_g6~~TRINITY_DN67242_c3_g6_i3.p1  ORF type:complete len:312 (-),score=43.87 TRINITY_DN67242_c3_g6_i3:56-991(-)
MDNFRQQFLLQLETQLAGNRAVITQMTEVAQKHHTDFAFIVEAIVNRIKTAPYEKKIHAWYLTDSIVKKVGGNFSAEFERHLPSLVLTCMPAHDAVMRERYNKMINTWKAIFTFNTVETILNNFKQSHPEVPQPQASSVLHHPPVTAPPPGQLPPPPPPQPFPSSSSSSSVLHPPPPPPTTTNVPPPSIPTPTPPAANILASQAPALPTLPKGIALPQRQPPKEFEPVFERIELCRKGRGSRDDLIAAKVMLEELCPTTLTPKNEDALLFLIDTIVACGDEQFARAILLEYGLDAFYDYNTLELVANPRAK